MNSIFKKQTKSLKEAFYDTIHHHPLLSVQAIAEELGMGVSYLYNSCKPDSDTDGETATGVRFPAKQIVPLCRVTDNNLILDVMEWQRGRVAIKLPDMEGKDPGEIRSSALKAVVEFGNLMNALEEALEDGVITEKEKQRINKEGREVIQAVLALLFLDGVEL